MRVPRQLNGFTLLEMMLALVLMAVGTVAIIDLLRGAQAGATDGENVLIATTVAQRCLEGYQRVPYAQLGTASATTVCNLPASPLIFTKFTPTVTVTPQTSVSPYNTASLTQLDVQVAWAAPGASTTANVTLSTLRAAN